MTGTFCPLALVVYSGGRFFSACGGLAGATGDVMPTALNTEAGTFVICWTVVGLAACQLELLLGGVELPDVSLTMTNATPTTTTRPTASQVNRPAGRPRRAGARLGRPPLGRPPDGRLTGGFFVATKLL